jgi:hypothetical protein
MGILLFSTGIIQQLESSSGELATPQDQNVNNNYGDPTVFNRNYTAAGKLVWRVSNTAVSKCQQ